MNRTYKNILRSLPHSLVYHGYRLFRNQKFKELQQLRTKDAGKDGYTLKGFDEHKCIFIHIPKTGGMSLSLSLFGNCGGGHRTYFSYYPIYSPEEYQQYFKFAIVRNPWDRLVSAYFFLKDGGLTDMDQQWFEKNLSQYDRFEDFVRQWVTRKNVYSYLHFIPQHYYVSHLSNIMIDKVYKLEHISAAVQDMNDKLGLDITLPHKNKTTNREAEYRQYYNDETREIVRKVYQEDIRLFDYSF
jgi:hypothetical protein